MMKNSLNILGVSISNITLKEGLEEVRKWLIFGGKKRYIVTPNPEFLVRAQHDREFYKILNAADLALPDGIGLIWASRLWDKPLKERVSGVEFMLGLCKMAEKEGFSIGLIGGRSGVALRTAECLLKLYPKIKIVLASEEWPEDMSLRGRENRGRSNPDGVASSHSAPRNDKVDILFVAFGAPKQEKWIAHNLEKIPVRVAMGVGGSFDYISGVVPRAPKLMRNFGLEWIFRLIRQPWRAFRQLALIKFVFLIFKERFFRHVL